MKKIKVTFDDNGFPLAFYPSFIAYDNIPKSSIEIDEVQWREFLDNAGKRVWKDGKVVEYVPPAPAQTFPSLTARQFWQAALMIGVKEEDLVSGIADEKSPFYIADKEDRESVLIDITKSTTFSHDFPLLEKMAAVANMPKEQFDTLWQWAANMQ